MAAALLDAAVLCAFAMMKMLWWLPDVTEHGMALAVFVTVIVFTMMFFLLMDGGFTVLRFGVRCENARVIHWLFVAAQICLRVINVLILLWAAILAVLCLLRWGNPHGAVIACLWMVPMLAGLIAVLRLEKWIRSA